MDEDTQKIINEQIKNLSEDIKKAIVSVDFLARLQEITKRQRLLVDQAGKLEMETTLVMIGLEPLSDYIQNLKRELGISLIKAQEIAVDVDQNIFKQIRNSLETMDTKAEETPEAVADSDSEPELEPNLNREQILKEIEDPSTIAGGNRVMEMTSPKPVTNLPANNLVVDKMSKSVVISQQITEPAPTSKLPEASKERPTSEPDPYREPIS